jgi:hypothetical protein
MKMKPTIGHPSTSLGKSTWNFCAGIRGRSVLACMVLSLKGCQMTEQHAASTGW